MREVDQSQTDIKSDVVEKLDMFIIRLGFLRRSLIIQPKIIEGIKSYWKQEFKWNPMSILNSEIYRVLKPRLQKAVQDIIFSEFNSTFSDVLEDCDPEFCRQLFSSCKLESMLGTHREDVDTSVCRPVELIKIN